MPLVVHLCHKFRAINLMAPVFICAIEKQGAVVRSWWAESVQGAEMQRMLSVYFENSTVAQQGVCEWTESSKIVTKALGMTKEPVHQLADKEDIWVASHTKSFFLTA